jgi:hypothetical protein
MKQFHLQRLYSAEKVGIITNGELVKIMKVDVADFKAKSARVKQIPVT